MPFVTNKGSKAGSLEGETVKTGAANYKAGLTKRGGNSNANDQSINDKSTVKKDGKIEIARRGSKENLKSDQQGAVQRRKSGSASPQQKAPSRELQNMATKLRTYTGKRPPRPVSYCPGTKLTEPTARTSEISTRRSGIPGGNIRSSASMQNLAKKEPQELKTGFNANKLALSKSKSSNSLWVNNETFVEIDIDTLNRDPVQESSATGPRKQLQGSSVTARKPASGLVFPRSKSSSSKTTNSCSSEFGTSSVQLGAPYQSTPLRSLSTDNDDLGRRPLVGGDDDYYASISGVFDYEGPVHENQTFKKIPENGNFAANKTFDGADAQGNPQFLPDAKSRRVCNDTFTTEPDVQAELGANDGDFVRNKINETFDKGSTTFTQSPTGGTKKKYALNATEVVSETEALNATEALNRTEALIETDVLNTTRVLSSREPRPECSSLVCDVSASPVNASTAHDKSFEKIANDTISLGTRPSSNLSKETRADKVDINTENDHSKSYCSADFLENESMPRLDTSYTINLSGNYSKLASLVETSETQINQGKNHVIKSDSNLIGGEAINEHDGECPDDSNPRSVSRSLDFAGIAEDGSSKARALENEALEANLANNSYDFVTYEEVLGTKDDRLNLLEDSLINDSSVKKLGATVCMSPRDLDLVDISNSPVERPNSVPCKLTGSSPGALTEQDGNTGAEPVNKDDTSLSSRSVEHDKENKNIDPGFSGLTDSTIDQNGFSSLLSMNLEKFDKKSEVSLLENTLVVLNASNPPQNMKIAARRRSLVRRNTSPYNTSLLPVSVSPGPNFRMPKETSITETEDGNVVMDESTYRQCKNDVRVMKTNILRLKRCLQQVSAVCYFL